MDKLAVLSGPELDFIIPEHKEDFIKHLIVLYCSEMEVMKISNQLNVSKRMFPDIQDIYLNTESEFLLAGLVTRRSGDPELYLKDAAKIHPLIISKWADTMLAEIIHHYENIDDDEKLMFMDIQRILNHYNMSYVNEYSSNNMVFGAVYNSPLVFVW